LVDALPRDDARLHLVADALRRRLALILCIALLIAAAIGAYAYTQTAKYTSSASVFVRPIPGNALAPGSTSDSKQVTVGMATEAGLMNSPGVVDLVNEKLHTSIESGTSDVVASIPANTQIIEVQYTASSKSAAKDGAQAFADSFLAYRAAISNATIKTQLNSLEAQERTASANLKTATSARATGTATAAEDAQVQLSVSRLVTVQNSIGELQSTDTNPGSVIKTATTPSKPAGLSPLLYVIAGAILGLVIGVVVAIWRERKDDRVRAAAEVSVAEVPILANLPNDRQSTGRLVTAPGAPDETKDAYRRARAGIVASVTQPAALVVSDLPGQNSFGRVAANLALTLGAAGFRVCLVDTTDGSEGMSRLLGIKPGPGLSDVMEAAADLQLAHVDGISVLTCGTDPEGARELYSGARFAELMTRLREQYSFIVIAGPAASSPDSDGVALASDGVVLVAADKKTTHRQVAHTAERNDQLGIVSVGLICAARGRQHRDTGLPEPRISSRPVPAQKKANRADKTGATPGSTLQSAGASRTGDSS
jgi:polysaccharide biosynthesis transport protein